MKGEIKKTYHYKKIIKNIDIVKELKRYDITGKISGDDLMICCPIHLEKNPSFGINIKNSEKKGLCKCLSCGWTGTFFSFLAYIQESSLDNVLKRYLKNDIDIKDLIELKKYLISFLQENNKKKNNIKYYKNSFIDKFKNPYGPYLRYLIEERKLNKNIIKIFNIKCCDGSGTGYGKIWNKRIIIPIYQNKKLVGVTARSIIKEISKKDKVRKIKDSDISKILFGIENILPGSPLIGVEGEIDVIYLQQFFIPAVRTGKTISKEMIKLIYKFTNNFVYSPDGDVPYINKDPKLYFDSIRFIRNKISCYIPTDLIILPENKDPNNLNKKEIFKYYNNYINENYFTKKFKQEYRNV